MSAHVNVPKPHQIYQAELLFLPHDQDYKYALVVVDCATHAMRRCQPTRLVASSA